MNSSSCSAINGDQRHAGPLDRHAHTSLWYVAWSARMRSRRDAAQEVYPDIPARARGDAQLELGVTHCGEITLTHSAAPANGGMEVDEDGAPSSSRRNGPTAASIEEAAKKFLPAREPPSCSTTPRQARGKCCRAAMAGGSKSNFQGARDCASSAHMVDDRAFFTTNHRDMQHLHTERLAAVATSCPARRRPLTWPPGNVRNEVSAYQTLVAMAHDEQDAFGFCSRDGSRSHRARTFQGRRTPDAFEPLMLQIAAGIPAVSVGRWRPHVDGGRTTCRAPSPSRRPPTHQARASRERQLRLYVRFGR